jgi:hypothetical protein
MHWKIEPRKTERLYHYFISVASKRAAFDFAPSRANDFSLNRRLAPVLCLYDSLLFEHDPSGRA